MVREDLLPVLNKAGRYGLCPDMHQPPLIELVVGKGNISVFNGDQDILGPGYQEPDNRGFFFRDRLKNPLGFNAFQNHRLGSHNKISEPVHFGPCVVKWRDTKKIVFMCLIMMAVFNDACKFQVPVCQKDGFGLSCCPGGKIKACFVQKANGNIGTVSCPCL